ncbi:protein YgfX [Ectopseudomonas mendocina]|uniref:Protein YgfX n=1 Tax=Ectopseudomonas mendocina TaxID=300 RepID=A0ABZ2REX9_ECTME
MSSLSDYFECRWRASRWLLCIYALLQAMLLCCLYPLDLAVWCKLLIVLMCISHAVWVVPRYLLNSRRSAYQGLRWTESGWQVFSESEGWQAIELHPDSLALPLMVFLRFRLAGQRRVRSLCVARDSLSYHEHRRLRVRLKFSRYRWAVAE